MALGRGAGGWEWSGGMGVYTHMCTHTCTHMHGHVYMYRNYKWPTPWRHPCLSCLQHACAGMCMCTCMHAWDTPPHTPIPTCTPIHTPAMPPQGGTPGISKKSITLELIKIIWFCFEDLKSVENFPPMSGCMVWWMGGLMGQITKNLKNQDNSIVFEDLWFVETPPPMGGYVGGWVGQWVGQVKSLEI